MGTQHVAECFGFLRGQCRVSTLDPEADQHGDIDGVTGADEGEAMVNEAQFRALVIDQEVSEVPVLLADQAVEKGGIVGLFSELDCRGVTGIPWHSE